jgi:hypothetical protein
MYLVVCTQCHTSFSKDAKVCPSCGYLRRHVASPPEPSAKEDPAVVVFGEATWWRSTSSL